MARAKGSRKAPSKTKKRVKRASRVNNDLMSNPYKRLLVDPCTAPLLSPYGGERGIIERFVADVTFGAATHTCGVAFVQPASNAYGGFSAPTSTTITLCTSAAAVAEGFLQANAQKVRPIACCLELIPASLSITNITGELAMAVFDSTTIGGGFNTTADRVFALANDREVLQKRDYEIKWYPNVGDALYNNRTGSGGTFNPAEQASQNEVVIAWRGIPAGTLLSFRITIVYEWTPIPGLGLAATSAPGRSLDWQNHNASLHETHPNWWSGKPAKMTFAESYRKAASTNSVSKTLYQGLTDYQHLIPQVLDLAINP